MAHDGYTGLSSVTFCGVSLTGMRNASIEVTVGQDMRAADNDLWPKGALSGAAACRISMSTDKINHGVTEAATGTSAFTATQAATTKATAVANCVVTRIGAGSVARGSGRAAVQLEAMAYSSDGSTSPVTWAT